ncbi:hypothetical protein [Ekhidna sp.]|uniref:hypothetical protein n=1 Tax=Ekhidna sp. TaxID=2608089 RepID=UPI0032971871
MRSLFIIAITLLIISCSSSEERKVIGKWYTYAESGDYMELWLSEDKAMTYLSSIDQFLLYDLKRDENRLKFSLIESKFIEEHNFELAINKSDEELFQATFIGDQKIDSLKTYFLLDREVPVIKSTLSENASLMEELFVRLESGSHAGHGH